jgi:hypothetical protein
MDSKTTNYQQEATDLKLLGGWTLPPVLINAEPLDFRLQCLPWNTKFRCRAGRSRYSTMALRESRFDHLQFAIGQHR